MGFFSGFRESRVVLSIILMVFEVFLGMVIMVFLFDKIGIFCGVFVKKEL